VKTPAATEFGESWTNESEERQMSNTTTVTGNLTREPEIRYTRDGQASTVLGVAVNRRWQSKETKEWEEATSFFDVVCWRELAENVALSLVKGSRVIVTGRLEQRSWETDEGEKRSKVEIVADEIGPSLRFATADVQRNVRHESTEAGTSGEEASLNAESSELVTSGSQEV
jgi:single-strand DNA-binding protein